MKDKVSILKIEGATRESFAAAFSDLVDTGLDGTGGRESDWTGSIDSAGNFALMRRRGSRKDRPDQVASLTGQVLDPDAEGRLEVAYRVKGSPVFAVSFFVIAAAAVGFLAWAIVQAASFENGRYLLPAGFFFGAALLLAIDFIIRPDCRALERRLLKIAEESVTEDE